MIKKRFVAMLLMLVTVLFLGISCSNATSNPETTTVESSYSTSEQTTTNPPSTGFFSTLSTESSILSTTSTTSGTFTTIDTTSIPNVSTSPLTTADALMDYRLTGFALDHVSIPQIDESDPSYYKVATPKEFMDAINAENSASKGTVAAKIIEITADLDMGYLEVTNQYGTFRNFESHNNASLHPRLIQTGIGKIVIQDRDGDHSKYNEGLMIYSKTGHTIRHATFMIKYSHNIIIRNLRFAELWEWDEKTKGNYDSNDWDYFTLRDVDGIWFDHIEMEKAYDGLIDFKGEDDPEDTVVNATFSFLDLDFQPNEFIREQFEYLEANQASNPYYKGMRDAGMSMEEILELNSFQKKGFLLGGSELRAGNRFTLTIYNSRLCNLQDRFPRLRGGDVHIFNCVYDASDVYRTRQEVLTNYPVLFGKTEYQRQLTNQAIVTTENGAVLVENSVFIGVSQPIKSNQVSADHPTMTGKYQVLNSIYRLDDTEFLGSSEDSPTPFVRSNSEPILPFSWTTIEALPYEGIALIDPTLLEALLDSAILGCTALTFPWMS